MRRYTRLITSQHRKPKFMATVEAAVKPGCELEDLLTEMRTVFDLDTAIGQQLDATGVRVGRTRYLHTPIEDVYFSWNEEGVGWQEGIWRGLYDPVTSLIRLPDDLYRILLKAKVAANHWDGTTEGAYTVWETVFESMGASIVIQDNQDMSIIVGIANIPLSPIFEQLLLQGYIPLKPAGVRIKWYATTPHGGPLFAWNCDNKSLRGWADDGSGGNWSKNLQPLDIS